MSAQVIGNPVPTPEEMGQYLGLSPERVAAVRIIMSTPSGRKSPTGGSYVLRVAARKTSRSLTSSKVRGKR